MEKRTLIEFVLLSHERELVKPSNTGQLLLQCKGVNTRMVIWARKSPDVRLLDAIAKSAVHLVYPLLGAEGQQLMCLEEREHKSAHNKLSEVIANDPVIVLIDATWQQAQKMFNQSPYLQNVPRLELIRERPSQFRLRRNQKKTGLCTVECAIELLRLIGERAIADELEANFHHFMSLPRIVSEAE